MKTVGSSTLRGGQTVFHGLRMWPKAAERFVPRRRIGDCEPRVGRSVQEREPPAEAPPGNGRTETAEMSGHQMRLEISNEEHSDTGGILDNTMADPESPEDGGDTTLLGDFLNHLETERGNDPRTRNTRLAAIRSFFRFVALHEPRYGALAQRVLAIPDKRHTRRPVAYLERDEIEALLRAPDPQTRTGRRDRTLLLVAVQTGLRASELIGLRCEDVQLGAGAHVRCHGKGRKERCTPLRKDAAAALRAWLKERRGESTDPVFPNQRGGSLSHDSLGYLLSKHLATARARCPSLAKKRVSVHSLRHSCAMELLQSGVDRAVIALWLGHESVETTYIYLHADLKLKEQAMARTAPSHMPPARYRPDDDVLAFLNSL